MKRTGKMLAGLLSAALLLTGCTDVTTENGLRANIYTYDEAEKELDVLTNTIQTSTVEAPVLDIYMDEVSEADALADISTFDITVQGTGTINIEIAAATEMSAEAPDDWLNIAAKNFNKAHYTIDGKSVSVTVRKITSGEALTYMVSGGYQPQVYIPSNYAWGEMLKSSGIGVEKITDRIAGNTAGILIEPDVYDSFLEEYGEATIGNVIQATLDGKLTFATTNPYTSSTGLNCLCEILNAFDHKDPLSSTASKMLIDYQKQSPPVAYTTAVLQKSAAKGIINAMVMEEQAYINTPELHDYIYIPFGIRHDHPVYTFDWDTEEEKQAAKMFSEYCMSEENQKLAADKGFNRHEDYQSSDQNMTGTVYLAAQRLWKQSKNGGKPIIAVFVSDVSGSMDGSPLNALKSSLVNASTYIGSEHYIGLVSYSNNVTVNLPIAQFDATQRAYFSGEVKNLSAGGGTATYDAVLVGLQMLLEKAEEIPDAKLLLFVLTDGEQNDGYRLSKVLPIVGGLQIPIYSIAYNYSDNGELEDLSGINEAPVIKADTEDIVNQLRNLFNVEM